MRLLLIFLTLCTLHATSQTVNTAINYQTWTGATGCNIFSSPTTVNGVVHQSTIGQPTYDATNHAVSVTGQVNSSGIYTGTEYRISYNFKAGYSYSLTVNATSINNQGGFPWLRLRLIGSTGTNTLCNGAQTIDQATSGNLTYSNTVNNSSYINYSYPFGTLSSAVPYLTVALVPVSGGGFQTILIRSITITETNTAPELVLSPTSLSTTCGTTTTQTFTVNNPNNVSGITGYTWNIGATPNGWLYNGSAAPASFSTTTNSILLTSVCGSIPKNVSVNVMKGSTVYKTYTCTVSNTQQTYAITGNAILCTGSATYTLSPSLCNASITWGSSDLNVATASGSGTSATVTQKGNGAITLTATLNNGCSNGNIVVAKSISVGVPEETISSTTNGPCNNGTQTWSLKATAINNITSWQWTKDPSATGSWYIYSPSSPSTLVDVSGGGGGIRLTTTNSCGSTLDGVSIYSNCPRIAAITASPNPATDELTIATEEPATMTKAVTSTVKNKIYRLEIVDQLGNVKKKFSYAAGVTSTKISVRDLVSGTYIIHAYNGKVYADKQIVVVH